MRLTYIFSALAKSDLEWNLHASAKLFSISIWDRLDMVVKMKNQIDLDGHTNVE